MTVDRVRESDGPKLGIAYVLTIVGLVGGAGYLLGQKADQKDRAAATAQPSAPAEAAPVQPQPAPVFNIYVQPQIQGAPQTQIQGDQNAVGGVVGAPESTIPPIVMKWHRGRPCITNTDTACK